MLQRSIILMIRDLFVFSLRPLMMLRREMRRTGRVVYKQSRGGSRSEGEGFTWVTNLSFRVFLGGCDKRHSMMGNHLIWLDVSGTCLSILGHFGFKGAIRTIQHPAELEAGIWAGFTLQLYSSTSPISWCDTAVLNDRTPLLNSSSD